MVSSVYSSRIPSFNFPIYRVNGGSVPNRPKIAISMELQKNL